MTDSAAIERAEWDARASTPEGALYQAWAGDDWDVATERHIEMILSAIGSVIGPGKYAFDLGCGPGRLTIPISDLTHTIVMGYDSSPSMIKVAKHRRGKDLKLTGFICTDGRSLPANDCAEDAGYSMQMFQHIPPEAVQGYLREVHRVLNPGGVFRFQFVEGDELGKFGYQFYTDDVVQWCHDAGLSTAIDTDPYQFNWRWITAMKA